LVCVGKLGEFDALMNVFCHLLSGSRMTKVD